MHGHVIFNAELVCLYEVYVVAMAMSIYSFTIVHEGQKLLRSDKGYPIETATGSRSDQGVLQHFPGQKGRKMNIH